MAGSVLALILALQWSVILTIGAGRNNEDKKVHLELLTDVTRKSVAVVVFMIWLMGTSVIVQAMDDEEMRIVWKTIGFWHFRTLVWNMVPGRMAQSGTKDQGEIALERQPVGGISYIGKKMLFEMQ